MLHTTALLVITFANPANQPKVAPANVEAAAEMLASWIARLRTLWETNEGIGVREERVTLRVWSEKDKRFDAPSTWTPAASTGGAAPRPSSSAASR